MEIIGLALILAIVVLVALIALIPTSWIVIGTLIVIARNIRNNRL